MLSIHLKQPLPSEVFKKYLQMLILTQKIILMFWEDVNKQCLINYCKPEANPQDYKPV